jgi:hypothetical protein
MLIQLDTTYPDGRRILESGVTIRQLPLPVKYRSTYDDGCAGPVTVGNIDQVEIRDGTIYASGTFLDNPELDMPPLVASTIDEAIMRSCSRRIGPGLDAGMVEVVNVETETGKPVTDERFAELIEKMIEDGGNLPVDRVFTRYEVAGVTLTPQSRGMFTGVELRS